MAVQRLAQFSAVYCSGAYVPDASAVTALSLLFDKVYLPNNIQLVKAIVTKFRIAELDLKIPGVRARLSSDDGMDDLFVGLTDAQTDSAKNYLMRAAAFAHAYSEMYGPVFESEMFPNSRELVISGSKPDNDGKQLLTLTNTFTVSLGDDLKLPELIESGYVPVVGRFHAGSSTPDLPTTKQLASLLAMNALRMALPRTRFARPAEILEARHRLRDQLPPFWSSMLKASVELRSLIGTGLTHAEINREASELVDRTIRPAAIDLASKLEKERADWFYRVLAPVRTGLRLLVGAPAMNQQQLATTAMLMVSDACVSTADSMRTIESLKRDSGLTYLLDLADSFAEENPKGGD